MKEIDDVFNAIVSDCALRLRRRSAATTTPAAGSDDSGKVLPIIIGYDRKGDPMPDFKITPVDAGLYRGSRPMNAADWSALHSFGFKTILNLEYGFYEEVLFRVNEEVEQAVLNDITPLNIRLSDVIAPKAAELNTALLLIDKFKPSTLFVHCLHGVDRTGMVCAAYRMKRQGWSYDDAVAEMDRMGFHELPYTCWKEVLKQL